MKEKKEPSKSHLGSELETDTIEAMVPNLIAKAISSIWR